MLVWWLSFDLALILILFLMICFLIVQVEIWSCDRWPVGLTYALVISYCCHHHGLGGMGNWHCIGVMMACVGSVGCPFWNPVSTIEMAWHAQSCDFHIIVYTFFISGWTLNINILVPRRRHFLKAFFNITIGHLVFIHNLDVVKNNLIINIFFRQSTTSSFSRAGGLYQCGPPISWLYVVVITVYGG